MNANELTITVETDPAIWAEAKARREKFDKNHAWLEANASEVFRHRGKFYCISGQQLFIGDSASECLQQAVAKFPDDDGRFTGYVPKERVARIYAHRR